jgi:hypothetical protein
LREGGLTGAGFDWPAGFLLDVRFFFSAIR